MAALAVIVAAVVSHVVADVVVPASAAVVRTNSSIKRKHLCQQVSQVLDSAKGQPGAHIMEN